MSGYVMLYGAFGSSPTMLWSLFTILYVITGISYGMTYNPYIFEAKMKTASVGIISYWNDGFNGIHTFMIRRSGSRYQTYNALYDTTYKSISKDIIGRRVFIVGYWF